MNSFVIGHGSQAEPVFVVGMNGSGTTMLADSLGQHPELYSFIHETKLLPYIIAQASKYGDLAINDNFVRLWTDLASLPGVINQTGEKKLPLPLGWEGWERSYAGAIDGLFNTLAALKEGKIRWCEKTPMHALHMSSLSRIFPRAKFIHVIRDGRDCAASFHRRWKRTPELTIYRWRVVINEARRQGRVLEGRYLEIKFEDLTANPELWMKKACEFIGLPYDSVVLKARRNPTTNPERDRIEPNGGKWKSYFSQQRIARLERISAGTLNQLGYETQCNGVDHAPLEWKQKWWLYKDYGRQLMDETAQQLRGHPYRSWTLYFRYLGSAFKQLKTNKPQ